LVEGENDHRHAFLFVNYCDDTLRPRAAASFGVPAPISKRIRIPRLWPATWIR
jgi:hypothetical protein